MTRNEVIVGAQQPDAAILEAAWSAIRGKLGDGLTVAGICGSQASGKSTLSAALVRRAADEGVPAVSLSLDDIYLTRAEREELARTVHPLLRTRGVPGTHDVALGLQVIAALERGEAALLPRFDKGTDDRAPQSAWDRAPANTRLLIFEGWCTGAVPQDEAALAEPVNALERDEDPDGSWRGHANHALAGEYRALFPANIQCQLHEFIGPFDVPGFNDARDAQLYFGKVIDADFRHRRLDARWRRLGSACRRHYQRHAGTWISRFTGVQHGLHFGFFDTG